MRCKAKFVISDTHIGAGGAEEGNKLEDFISDANFVAWIHGLVEESEGDDLDMELIINGDWIEFLQIPSVDRFKPHHQYDTQSYTHIAEADALKRLEIIHEWHPSIFLGLSDFLNPGPPRRSLIILYGNHDPELAYPGVQARIREMVNASGQDAGLVEFSGRSYFKDGVYIEHGNAYVESLNRFTDPDHPFDPDHPQLIERPPGSHFVTYFFNPIEWQRPWIDGVHPMTSLIFYALAYEPSFALDVLKAFLSVAPDLLLNLGVAGGHGPTASQKLLTQLEDPAQRQQLAQRLQTDPDFTAAFSQEVRQALIEKGAAPTPPEGVAGAPGILPPELSAREITEQYWRILEATAERLASEKEAQVVLFGHIHEEVERQFASGAIYLNTGCWVWKGNFSEASDALWRDLVEHPEKYMYERKLAFARIDIDERGAITSARLRHAKDDSKPPVEPGPQPKLGLWARFMLWLRRLFGGLFG